MVSFKAIVNIDCVGFDTFVLEPESIENIDPTIVKAGALAMWNQTNTNVVFYGESKTFLECEITVTIYYNEILKLTCYSHADDLNKPDRVKKMMRGAWADMNIDVLNLINSFF